MYGHINFKLLITQILTGTYLGLIMQDKFLKLVLDCYLEQHVHQFNNILDLVFTSKIQIIDDIQVLAPIDDSDHNVLVCTIRCCKQPVKAKTQLCYNQADYNAMHEIVLS